MNFGIIIGAFGIGMLIGFMLGDWKETRAVRKAIDELSAMHYGEIQLIVNKILASRKNEKGGE